MTNDPIDLLKRVVGDSQLKADPEAYLKKHKGNYTEALRNIAKDNGLQIDPDQEKVMHEAYKLPVINRAYFEDNWKSDKEIEQLENRRAELFNAVQSGVGETYLDGFKTTAKLDKDGINRNLKEISQIKDVLQKNEDLREFGFNKIDKPAFEQRDLAGARRDIKNKRHSLQVSAADEFLSSEQLQEKYAPEVAKINKEADEMEVALLKEKEDMPVVVSYPTAAKNAAVEVGGSTKNQWGRALGIMKEADSKLTRQIEMAAEDFEAAPTEENKAKLDVLIAHGNEQRRQFNMGFGGEVTIRNEEEKFGTIANNALKNSSWLEKAGVTIKSKVGRGWHGIGAGIDNLMGRFTGESLDDFLDRREVQGKAAAQYQDAPGFSGGSVQRYVDVDGQRFHVDQHGDILSAVDKDMNVVQGDFNAIADKYNKNKDQYEVNTDFSASRMLATGVEVAINMLPIIAGTVATSFIPGVGQTTAGRAVGAFASSFVTMFGDDFERSLQAGRGFDHAWNTAALSSGIKSAFEIIGGVEAKIGKELGEGVKDILIRNTETLAKKYGTQNLPKKFWNEWFGMMKKELPPETATEVLQDFSDAHVNHAMNGMELEIDPLDEFNMVLSMPFAVGGFGLASTYFKNKKDKDVWKRSYIAAIRSGKQIETVFDESVKAGKLTEEGKRLKIGSLDRERDQVTKVVGNLSLTDKQVDKVLTIVAEKAMNLELAAGTQNAVKAEKYKKAAEKIQEKIDSIVLDYSKQPESQKNVRDNYLFNSIDSESSNEDAEFESGISEEATPDGEGQPGAAADPGVIAGQPGATTTNPAGTQPAPVSKTVPPGEQLPVLAKTTSVVPYSPRVTFYGVMGENAVVKNEDGESGVIKVDEGGKVTVDYDGRIEELGNIDELSDETLQDHGLTVEDASAVANRTYKVGNDTFVSDNLDDAIEFDEDGNVASVTLVKVEKGKASKGQVFTGQQAENLAYQITLDKFSNLQSNEGIRAIEALIPEEAGGVPETTPEGKTETAKPGNTKPEATEKVDPKAAAAAERKRRTKIINNHLLDNDGDVDGAFEKAGYTNHNGIWVAPEALEYAKQVSPEAWQHLKDKGIRYFEGAIDGRGMQMSVVYDGKSIRGIGVNERVGEFHSGHDHTVYHEAAHHVWQEELTPEQKKVFKDDNPVSDYAKSVKDGKEETMGKYDEEDFAELYARNKGDINKAIEEKNNSKEVRQKIATAKVVVDGKVKSITVIVPDLKKTEAEILEMADNGEITHLEALAILQSAFKKKYTNKELNDIVAKSLEKKEEAGLAETNLEELEHDAEAERDDSLFAADERRDKGEFKEDGVTYKRNEKSEGIKGKSGEVRFTNTVVVPFTYKLVEADNLQPSHQGGVINKKHFLPETQPKPRTGDDSKSAEDGFADAPRFGELGQSTNAYSGAPVINERDEVIQGHSRSAGFKKGYSQGNYRYKNDLVNNAEKFGFTKEQVEGMTNPVLTREVKASDEKAVELGNYDVKDLETGGKRRVDPVAISRRMPYDVKTKILKLLFSGAEGTTNQQIKDNQDSIIKLVSPYINTTQRSTLIKDGQLTASGIEDMESLVEYFIFDGGHISLPELFDSLTHTQREGLKRALPFIYAVPRNKGLLNELQAAIIALNAFKASGVEFDSWLNQTDVFNEGMTPVDKYFPVELALAKKLDEAKNQTEVKTIFARYAELVNGTPGDMFQEATEGRSKKEAIKEQFNVTYNERQTQKQNKGGGEVVSGAAKTDTNQGPAAPAKTQEEVKPKPAKTPKPKPEPKPAPVEPLEPGNLAPNGKPSNLTPEQYKLVRTPAFKAWFGDWEKTNILPVTLEEIKNFPEIYSPRYDFSEDVAKFIDKKGNVVFLKRSGFGFHAYIKNDNPSKETLEGRNTLGWLKKVGTLVIDDSQRFSKSPKITFFDVAESILVSPEYRRNGIGSALIDFAEKRYKMPITESSVISPELRAVLDSRNNVSKVVDENGEPLVVYHGSQNPSLDQFDNDRTAYFTDNKKTASSFSDRSFMGESLLPGETPSVYPVFLNIRTPRNISKESEYESLFQDTGNQKGIKKSGNDGMVYKPEEGGDNYYATFFPSQIKTANPSKPAKTPKPKLTLSGKFSNVEGADNSVREIKELGEINQFNDKQVVIDGVKVSVERDGGKIWLKEISAIEQGKGTGTKVLKQIQDIADKNDIDIVLHPTKTKNTTDAQLEKWYKNNGFEDYTQGRLIYKAKSREVQNESTTGLVPRTGETQKVNPSLEEIGDAGTSSKKATRKIRDQAVADQINKAIRDIFASEGKELHSGGINPDTLDKSLKLIGLYVKQGVYKFSDIVEDAVGEFGDVIKEIFDALKAAYGAYSFSSATDEELEKMDGNLKNVKFEDIIKTKTDESKTETGTGGAGLDRVPEGVQPGLFQGADQEGDSGGASNEGGGAVQQESGGTKSQPRLRTGGSRGGGKNVSVPRTKPVEPDLFSQEAERLSSNEHPVPGEAPIIVGTILPNPAPLSNYVPNKEEDTAKSFSKTKHFAKNLKAIKTLLAIVKDGDRLATAEEKEILSDYVGWGGIKAVNRIAGSKYWSNSDLPFKPMYEELLGLVSEFEALGYKGLMNDIGRSTQNAHYTGPDVIRGIYYALNKLGFTGGSMLEPSAGVGNFIGYAPKKVLDKSSVTAIELDKFTGKILEKLYPSAYVKIKGYQDVKIANGSVDLVISNIPFGNYKVVLSPKNTDSDIAKRAAGRIHNYFFVKAIEQAREGGLVAFVTSTGVLDSPGNEFVRNYINDNTEFVGAIRLPSTTFKVNAGTEVVTDILFLKKNSGPKTNQDMVRIGEIAVPGGNVPINNYFINNPNNVIGDIKLDFGLNGKELVVEYDGNDIEERIKDIVDKYFPENVYTKPSEEVDIVDAPIGDEKVENRITIDSEGVFVYNNNERKPIDMGKEKAKAFIALRDSLDRQYKLESSPDATDGMVEQNRANLNRLYDSFVGVYKKLNTPKNVKDILKDKFGYNVLALERIDKETGKTVKADIFKSRGIVSTRRATKASNISDAISISYNESGAIDVDRIASLLSEDSDGLVERYYGELFYDTDGTAVGREEYLSGNVKKKYKEALAMADVNELYQKNVEALAPVLPKDIPIEEIDINIGQRWVPVSYYKEFADFIFKTRTKVKYEPITDSYAIDGDKTGEASGSWAVGGKSGKRGGFMDGFALFIHAIHGSSPVIYMDGPTEGTRVVDQESTQSANEKVEKMGEEFRTWIVSSPERAEVLQGLYNDSFNTNVKRKFSDVFTVNGMSYEIILKEHQKSGANMIVTNNGGIIDHMVGAGKAQPLTAKILTPNGWTTMGEIKVGDLVISKDGNPTQVTGVFPQGEKEIYRVTFSDDSSTECCKEHLWETMTYRERNYASLNTKGKDWKCAKPKIRELSEIMTTLKAKHLGALNHSIPVVEPVLFNQQSVPLDPYLLGVLLGDGCLGHHTVTLTSVDDFIVDKVKSLLPDDIRMRMLNGQKVPTFSFPQKKKKGFGADGSKGSLVESLNTLGVRVDSYNKFIPEVYKFNSIEVRTNVLRGLMDTDGYVSKKGTQVEYASASISLINDVKFIVQSLGGTASVRSKMGRYKKPDGTIKETRINYTLSVKLPASINPFYLPRKAEQVVPKSKYKPIRYIKSVEIIGKKEAQCISVEHPSHLYVTDDFILTHNTFLMISAALKMRQLGVANKPMIVGLKSTIQDLASDAKKLFPMAKVLSPSEADFTRKNRKKLLSTIQNNDWDLIIISHEQFGAIPQDKEFHAGIIEKEIEEIEAALALLEAESGEAASRKLIQGLTKRKENLRAKLAELADFKKDDELLSFKEIGIDHLFVDESQAFKNLTYTTRINRVAGLGKQDGSKRAYNMLIAARTLQALHGGDKGVTFVSGTPISNSLVEMYLLLKYLRPKRMQELGYNTFDAWINQFAIKSKELEFTAGGIKVKDRFREFVNVPELSLLYNEIADVRNEHNLTLKRPKIRGGKPTLVAVKQSEAQQEWTDRIIKFVNQEQGKRDGYLIGKGRPLTDKEQSAAMLMAITIGSKLSNDIRLVDKNSEFNPEGKLVAVANKVKEEYENSKDIKGTQLIFSDIGTPKTGKIFDDLLSYLEDEKNIDPDTINLIFGEANEETGVRATKPIKQIRERIKEYLEYSDTEIDFALEEAKNSSLNSFNTYNEIKRLLISKGIPDEEIVFIHDYKNKNKRQALFADVNSGKVRVVLGSTQKLGTGVNVQKRIVAMHHVDAKWTPADMEQRNGRGIRQGNMNEEVAIYQYGTEQTVDADKYQLIATKQKFINQIKLGSLGSRTVREDDGADMTAQEFVAMISGNPLLLEKAKLEATIAKLNRSEKAFIGEQSRVRSGIMNNEASIPRQEGFIEKRKKDMETAAKNMRTDEDGKEIPIWVIDGKQIDDPKTRRELFEAKVNSLKGKGIGAEVVIGQVAGLNYTARNITDPNTVGRPVGDNPLGLDFSAIKFELEGEMVYPTSSVPANVIFSFQVNLDKAEKVLADTKKELESYKGALKDKWPKEEELTAAKVRLAQVVKELTADKEIKPTEEVSDDSDSDPVENIKQRQADQELNEAKEDFKAAWKDMNTLGIASDPWNNAERVKRVIDSLFRLAVAKGISLKEDILALVKKELDGISTYRAGKIAAALDIYMKAYNNPDLDKKLTSIMTAMGLDIPEAITFLELSYQEKDTNKPEILKYLNDLKAKQADLGAQNEPIEAKSKNDFLKKFAFMLSAYKEVDTGFRTVDITGMYEGIDNDIMAPDINGTVLHASHFITAQHDHFKNEHGGSTKEFIEVISEHLKTSKNAVVNETIRHGALYFVAALESHGSKHTGPNYYDTLRDLIVKDAAADRSGLGRALALGTKERNPIFKERLAKIEDFKQGVNEDLTDEELAEENHEELEDEANYVRGEAEAPRTVKRMEGSVSAKAKKKVTQMPAEEVSALREKVKKCK